MLEVRRRAIADQEDAEDRFLQRRIGRQNHLILFPLCAGDFQGRLADKLVLAHGCGVHQFDAELRRTSVRNAGPNRETVGLPSLDADAEKTFIVQTGPFVGMTGIRKADIMRTTVERAVVADRHFTESFPALERVLREFEGAVLHEFGVQAAVGREVDVLEEDAVHGGLDGSADFLEVDVHPVRLGGSGQAEKKGRSGQKDAVANHHDVVRFCFRFSNLRKIT